MKNRDITNVFRALLAAQTYSRARDDFETNAIFAIPTDVAHNLLDFLGIKELANIKSVNKMAYNKVTSYSYSDRFVPVERENYKYNNTTISKYVDDFNETVAEVESRSNLPLLEQKVISIEEKIRRVEGWRNDGEGTSGGDGCQWGFISGGCSGWLTTTIIGTSPLITIISVISCHICCAAAGACLCTKYFDKKKESLDSLNNETKSAISDTRTHIREQIMRTTNRNPSLLAQPPETKHSTIDDNRITDVTCRLLDNQSIDSRLNLRSSFFGREAMGEKKNDTALVSQDKNITITSTQNKRV